MNSFRNIRDDGILDVANAAERLVLLPSVGMVVLQLDDMSLWGWDGSTWVALGSGGGGAFTGVTGNPSEIAYFDLSGNGTGDSQATRISDQTKQTDIFANTKAKNVFGNNSSQGAVQADLVGVIGNSINLVFDGIIDIDTAVATWNTANPSNTATVINGGTVVPDAQNTNLVGGGIAGIALGETSLPLFGGDVHGYGVIATDQTNNFNAINIAGNISELIGPNGFGTISGYIDSLNDIISVALATNGGINIFYTDQATFNSNMEITDSTISLRQNDNEFMVDSGFGAYRFIGGSTTVNLGFNSTANLGDVLSVTSISGSDINLGFVAPSGGGSPGGSNFNVQYNDGGVFGGDVFFTWDKVNKDFFVGNNAVTGSYLTLKNVSGNTNLNASTVTLSRPNFDASTQVPFFKGSVSDRFTIVGDVDDKENRTKVIIYQDGPSTNTIQGIGARKNTVTSATFSAGGSPGPNSNLADAALNSNYTGNGSNSIFTATITNLNTQTLQITSVVGTPQVGDQVTGFASGATGTVYNTDGLTYINVENVTGGVFSPTEVLNAVAPATWTAATTSAGALTDLYTFDNGPNSAPGLNCSLSPGLFFNGVNFIFQNPTGHAINDTWTSQYGVTFGELFNFNGQSGIYTLGTSSAFASQHQVQLEVNDPSDTVTAIGRFFVSKGVGPVSPTLRVDNSINNVQMGAYGFANNTFLEVDDSNQTIKLNSAKTKISLTAYADDAAAGIAGLIAGEMYQTDGTGSAPLNVAGIVMVKQ